MGLLFYRDVGRQGDNGTHNQRIASWKRAVTLDQEKP